METGIPTRGSPSAGRMPAADQQEEVVDVPVRAPPQNQNVGRQELLNLTHIEKLTRENFGDWKFQMSVMFRTRKLLNIVDGSVPMELYGDDEDWLDKDAQCQSIIVSAVDNKLIRRLMTCKTSSQMWRRLSTVFEQNATENLQMLQQQFYDLRMNPDEDVVDHISRVE
jgi:hypothetical protein